MRKNSGRWVVTGLSVMCVWCGSGIAAFATEGINQASVITQTGSVNVFGYIAVGVAMAGVGFLVRKKI